MQRYLTGNYAPVTEELTVTDLPVLGHVPEELSGRYLRNGPNPVTPPEPSTYHWFVGDGMVHGIRLRDGRAEWYRNRWVRSKTVSAALGEEPKPGPEFGGMDFAANTNIVGHAGRTLAIVEAGSLPYELSYDLDTVQRFDFDGTLEGGYTAHPKRDPRTGELHAISYHWAWGNVVRYTVVDPAGKVRRSVDVEVGGPVSIHDMSLTERYAVVYDLPVVFDLDLAMAGTFPYRWDPDYPSRVGLLPREAPAADISWFDVEPCYVFHPLNAFDDGDRVVLDVTRHDRVFADRHDGPGEGISTLNRWTIDTAAGKLLEERLDDRCQEFPRVDERRVGLRHRYGYLAGKLGDDHCLIKQDLDRGTSDVRMLPVSTGDCEPVFVPRHDDAAEDDGWVMALVQDAERDASNLLVLDAADIGGDPIAVVQLPQRVPFGFHGNWVPDTLA